MEQTILKIIGDAALPKEGAPKGTGGGPGDSNFQKLLESQMNQSNDVEIVQKAMGIQSEPQTLQAIPADRIQVNSSLVGLGSGGDRTSGLLRALNEVNRGALQMDQMIEMVTTGESFSPQELLAIQAGVYQIVQEVDLTGQIVSSADRARNSLLNIQI